MNNGSSRGSESHVLGFHFSLVLWNGPLMHLRTRWLQETYYESMIHDSACLLPVVVIPYIPSFVLIDLCCSLWKLPTLSLGLPALQLSYFQFREKTSLGLLWPHPVELFVFLPELSVFTVFISALLLSNPFSFLFFLALFILLLFSLLLLMQTARQQHHQGEAKREPHGTWDPGAWAVAPDVVPRKGHVPV